MTDKQIIYNCPHISFTDWGTYACKLYNPRDNKCLVQYGNCESNTNCPYKQNFEKDIDVPSKQMIIDGCNVSGCNYYTDGKCTNSQMIQSNCKNVAVCYYKEYKRKEQECEKLKAEIDIRSCANIELSLEFKKYKKAIDEIEEIADNNYENPEMERIFKIIGGLDV